jgi:DNA-binding IclR family transcriptional regulator
VTTEANDAAARSGRPVQAVSRAVALLDAIASRDVGASLAELSRQTGLHKTTAWRLLATLRDSGLVRYLEDEEQYTLGSKALEFGVRARAQMLPVPVVRAVLVRLRDRINETCHLAVPEGAGLVYVEKVESTQAVRIASSVGARLPLHCTALGKSYLAFQREDVIEDRLSVLELGARTERTITDTDRLRRELQRVRERGFAIDDRENELQMRCVGAPIIGEDGTAVAAISVSAPVARFSVEEAKTTGRLLLEAADELGTSVRSAKTPPDTKARS